MAKNSLIKLAKGTDRNIVVKPKATKSAEKKSEKKPLSPEEERDIKVKERVDELLDGVDLKPKKDDELLEVENESPKGTEWLTEQIAALTTENELLKGELTVAKADYSKIFIENQRLRSGANASTTSDNNILTLFNELQNHYLKYPPAIKNQTDVNVKYLLDKMCDLFPIVLRVKRF
jgi:hypothetical protein